MNKKAKADASNKGLHQNEIADGKFNGFDDLNYRRNSYFSQLRCRWCNSDYMKFSVGGFCIVQRAEFVKREHPRIVEAVRREALYD